MEWKSLIAGLVFALGMYAVKCGIGLACGVAEDNMRGRSLLFAGAAGVAYTLLFGGSYLLLTRINLLNQLVVVQKAASWAMAVHLIMASILTAWGVSLLAKPETLSGPVKGWWLFALPCPVCMGVVLLTVAFVIGFFPDRALAMTAVAWGVFAGVASLSFGLTAWMGARFKRPHHVMGMAMVLAALWFVLSVLVVPHVSELPDVFAMASHSAMAHKSGGHPLAWMGVSFLCLFFTGFSVESRLHGYRRF